LTHNGDVTYTPPRGKKGVFIKKEAKRRLPGPGDREKGRLTEKCEVIRVLVRASQDMRFWRALIEKGSDALSEYELTSDAKGRHNFRGFKMDSGPP
jgi:hypothetical protein